jgi:streptogramin lyase
MDSILMAAFAMYSARRKHRLAVVPAVLAVLALLSAGICPGAAAETRAGNVTSYDLSGYSNPYGMTTGPDGNIWFTEYNTPSAIGKITPSGTITSYPIRNPPGYGPVEITPGPGGTSGSPSPALVAT